MKKVFFLLLFCFYSAFLLAQNSNFAQRKVKFDAIKGQQAPDFEFLNLKNEKIKLSTLQGNIVVLNFFFIACPPCVKEIPFLNSLVDKYGTEKIKFISISRWDDAAKLKPFLEQNPTRFDVIPASFVGEQSETQLYAENKCYVPLYPSLLLIDKNGKIVYTQIGYTQSMEEAFIVELDKLLLTTE